MKDIAQQQQARRTELVHHSGKPLDRLGRVIRGQKLPRGVIARRLFQMQVADDQTLLARPEQRPAGM